MHANINLLFYIAGIDYETPSTVVFSYTQFSSRTRCTTITIIQDGVVENAELFFVELDNSLGRDPITVAINIQNSDSK